jgi:hypothetical protein
MLRTRAGVVQVPAPAADPPTTVRTDAAVRKTVAKTRSTCGTFRGSIPDLPGQVVASALDPKPSAFLMVV